ncbi:MAG: CPBP family intramembrane metalloprotease [Oscillospiraceae bacterium]|nr:CPBP family intramembrane metalloprotease [Oscillospiraceae bacterium]
MKENAIKFLYAIDCYLLYLLSGVAAAAGVVAYYSVMTVLDYGNIGEEFDSQSFVQYIADFVSGKSSVVLLVSYVIILTVLVLFFAIRRKSLSSYTGLSYASFLSVFFSAVLGVMLSLLTYALTPEVTSEAVSVDAVLVLCVILGPIVEELVFRGVLLKMFSGSCGIVAGTLVTSLLFSLSHTEPVQIVYSFILGVILCVVRVKSTSLWSVVLMHLAFNITGAISAFVCPELSFYAITGLFAVSLIMFIAACSGGRKLPARKMKK